MTCRDDEEMKNTVETINNQKSNKKGLVGSVETILRRFKDVAFILALLPIAILYWICLSAALWPAFFIFTKISEVVGSLSILLKVTVFALGAGFSVLSFILVLILVVPIFNWPIKFFVKPFRGGWYSLEAIPWYYHNALTYLVRYTVLNLITPSPLTIFFYRAMGMKLGKNVLLNTSNISDPCLIEIGDYATIGGSVYMMSHYGMKGYLIVDKLVIKHGANVGLHSYVMAAEIGEYATVLPNSAVLPKTKLPAYAKFGHTDQVIEIRDKSKNSTVNLQSTDEKKAT